MRIFKAKIIIDNKLIEQIEEFNCLGRNLFYINKNALITYKVIKIMAV
jgi:hypothetical protein